MNHRFVINQVGLLVVVLSGVMLFVAAYEMYVYLGGAVDEATAATALLSSAGIGLVVGGLFWRFARTEGEPRFGRREALLLVAVSWLVGAALAALPFWLWALTATAAEADHPFRSFVDCYFESMSGLTTTGATVLSDIESLPRGLLLWRALTHWLGGLGIVVLFVAVLPSLGVGGKRLFFVEAAGPKQSGATAHIRDTARILWTIYLALTVSQVLALRVCGMNWFDSVCHTFATLGTGGFSTMNASIGAYDSAAINYVTIFFMVLAGANFGLFYQMRRSVSVLWKDTEFIFYISLITIGTLIIAASLMMSGQPIVITDGSVVQPTVGPAVEHSLFQSVGVLTTTGFATSDFNQWPFAAKAVLVFFMFIGGCAGSTAGGIKVIRVWAVIKIMFMEIERVFAPNVIRPMRIGKSVIDPDIRLSIVVYTFGIVALFAIGSLAVMAFESNNLDPVTGLPICDYTTAATASLATLCTIGPGLNAIGAVENYGWMTAPTKILLSLWMALGRLEVFALFVLVVPRFWRAD